MNELLVSIVICAIPISIGLSIIIATIIYNLDYYWTNRHKEKLELKKLDTLSDKHSRISKTKDFVEEQQ